jgi:hypothetical protein
LFDSELSLEEFQNVDNLFFRIPHADFLSGSDVKDNCVQVFYFRSSAKEQYDFMTRLANQKSTELQAYFNRTKFIGRVQGLWQKFDVFVLFI